MSADKLRTLDLTAYELASQLCGDSGTPLRLRRSSFAVASRSPIPSEQYYSTVATGPRILYGLLTKLFDCHHLSVIGSSRALLAGAPALLASRFWT